MITKKELLSKTSPEFVALLIEHGLEKEYRKSYNPYFMDTHDGFHNPSQYVVDAFEWSENRCKVWNQLDSIWTNKLKNGNIKKDAHYEEERYDLGEEDVTHQGVGEGDNNLPHGDFNKELINTYSKVQNQGNKYERTLYGISIDVYDVLKAFDVRCPALQHLIKKALCAGLRGHKDKSQDLQDILDSAKRAGELNS